MLQPIITLIRRELSGQRALDHVAAIIQHHRIQASPGYRMAAAAVAERYQAAGLRVQTAAYPATPLDRYWGWPMFSEWHCEAAELWLLGDNGQQVERLASYAEMPLSVIQRTGETPPGGVTAEVAVLEEPEEASAYGPHLQGKVLLVGEGDLGRITRLARGAGAVGLLTDRMQAQPPVRPAGDLADARQYTSWWWGAEDEQKLWGFVLTPGQGARLRRLARRRRVQVQASIDAHFSAGSIENVEAVLEGSDPSQEVLVVSHLCHPRPSANDNATGPAVCLEVARVLQELIGRGDLPRPRRTIRFLNVPELTGTFAHLAHRAGVPAATAAALNVDMVGQDQARTGSVLLVEYPPLSCPSFAGDLLALVLAEVAREVPTPAGSGHYALFRHAVTPFSGGSDHAILADPAVAIPCPLLIQWPDRFYHTSADTLDKVDPAMLARAAVMAAAYAYFAAQAGTDEAIWLAWEMTALFPGQLHARTREAVRRGEDPAAVIALLLQRKRADLLSLKRLTGPAGGSPRDRLDEALALCGEALNGAVEHEAARWEAAAQRPGGPRSPGGPVPVRTPVPLGSSPDLVWAASVVPRRVQPGPVMAHRHIGRLPAAEQEAWHQAGKACPGAWQLETLLLYWCDGVRTLADACRLVELEAGLRDDAFAAVLMRLLAQLGLVELRPVSE